MSFCGPSWAEAIRSCSIETHCRTDSDCNNAGETCRGYLTGCNIVDMRRDAAKRNDSSSPPSPTPWASDPDVVQDENDIHDSANMSFCGPSWAEAIRNCSIETHCRTNHDCGIARETCHGYLTGCSIINMRRDAAKQNDSSSPPSPTPWALDPAVVQDENDISWEGNNEPFSAFTILFAAPTVMVLLSSTMLRYRASRFVFFALFEKATSEVARSNTLSKISLRRGDVD